MSSKVGSTTRCVGTGFVALDIIRSALDATTTLERRHAGGSCGNILAILSYLGLNASAVGRIGIDNAGDELLADLRSCKVDVRFLITEPGRRTPIIIQETYTDGRGRARHRFSRACPVCGATMPGYRPLLVADVPEVAATLPPYNLFFFDRVAAGTLDLARRSRRQGALVVFEPSGIKNEALFLECLRVSHVLKYSHERLSGLEDLSGSVKLPLEIETLATEGLRFRVRRSGQVAAWQHLPALPALSIRDSAGSGDWCTAGFLASIVAHGENRIASIEDTKVVVEGLRFGQALAALNCSYDGARGLMYAMSRAGAMKAAQQLLTRGIPTLPANVSPTSARHRSGRDCIVCA